MAYRECAECKLPVRKPLDKELCDYCTFIKSIRDIGMSTRVSAKEAAKALFKFSLKKKVKKDDVER